jgi:hypothetical protein
MPPSSNRSDSVPIRSGAFIQRDCITRIDFCASILMILNARRRKKSSAGSAPPKPVNASLEKLKKEQLREAGNGSLDCGATGIGAGPFVRRFETGNQCQAY